MMTLSLVGIVAFFAALLSTFLLLRSHKLLGTTRDRLLSQDQQPWLRDLQGVRPIAVIEDELNDPVDELISNAIEESKRKQRKIARDMAKRQKKIERELAD